MGKPINAVWLWHFEWRVVPIQPKMTTKNIYLIWQAATYNNLPCLLSIDVNCLWLLLLFCLTLARLYRRRVQNPWLPIRQCTNANASTRTHNQKLCCLHWPWKHWKRMRSGFDEQTVLPFTTVLNLISKETSSGNRPQTVVSHSVMAPNQHSTGGAKVPRHSKACPEC